MITAMADEFGGPIPVGPFAIIGDDSIGRGIVETLTGHRSRAVLMQNHGPFTIGATARTRSRPRSWSRMSRAPCTSPQQAGPLVPHSAGGDRLALQPLPERLRTDHRRPPVTRRHEVPTTEYRSTTNDNDVHRKETQ